MGRLTDMSGRDDQYRRQAYTQVESRNLLLIEPRLNVRPADVLGAVRKMVGIGVMQAPRI